MDRIRALQRRFRGTICPICVWRGVVENSPKDNRFGGMLKTPEKLVE